MRVAVIDIGSNSIKSIVAENDGLGNLRLIHSELIETRISEGISMQTPRLSQQSIQRGKETIKILWETCLSQGPIAKHAIVATSAVRSAANGKDFVEAVKDETGLVINILSGDQEAEAIALGALQDPTLRHLGDEFSLFDLGGGSVEFIVFKSGRLDNRISLELGAVRMTERFFKDQMDPISPLSVQKFKDFVSSNLKKIPFRINPPLVGMGGGVSVLKSLVGKNEIHINELNNWTKMICDLTLKERMQVNGIPAPRADIIPAAFIAFQAIMEYSNSETMNHSSYNLRYGLAAKLLIT